MTTEHRPVWRGVDPDRVDAAWIGLGRESLRARGTSVTAGYTVQWSLTTAAGWVTRELLVTVRDDEGERRLRLGRDGRGVWSAEGAAGLPDLAGALDCDLGLCPVTNLMPVLRHDLAAAARAGERRSAELVMAWVAVPELTLHASPQRYTALGPLPDGGAAVRFESEGFAADLELDPAGIVRHYPEIGTRIA